MCHPLLSVLFMYSLIKFSQLYYEVGTVIPRKVSGLSNYEVVELGSDSRILGFRACALKNLVFYCLSIMDE